MVRPGQRHLSVVPPPHFHVAKTEGRSLLGQTQTLVTCAIVLPAAGMDPADTLKNMEQKGGDEVQLDWTGFVKVLRSKASQNPQAIPFISFLTPLSQNFRSSGFPRLQKMIARRKQVAGKKSAGSLDLPPGGKQASEIAWHCHSHHASQPPKPVHH